MTEEKFELIKKSQWPVERKIKKKPFVISTSFGKAFTFLLVLFYLFTIKIKGRYNGKRISTRY